MRPKSLALLLLALGCGLVASIGITEVIARRNADSAGPTGETQAIFVAATDIGLGDTLAPQVLKLEQWPKDKIPQGAITRIENVEGRRAKTKIYADEPILENRLLGKGASEQGATALIPKGYRVVPVKVDLVSGGSSLILPGDRVDVMVHLVRDPRRDINETVTKTILQDIKVFAVNDVVDLEKEKEGSKSITAKTISLLVTPEQAAKVMLATQMGSVNLVMRSPDDDLQTSNAQAKPSELFAGPNSKANRGKESLVEEGDETPSTEQGKSSGFVDFLNTLKEKATAKALTQAVSVEAARTPQKWTMRMLKPGEVSELQFEVGEEDGASLWKQASETANTSASTSQNTLETAPNEKAPPPPDEPAVQDVEQPEQAQDTSSD